MLTAVPNYPVVIESPMKDEGTTTSYDPNGFAQTPGEMAQVINSSTSDSCIDDAAQEREPAARRGIRVCTKSRGCSTCKGPCGVYCCTIKKCRLGPHDGTVDAGAPAQHRPQERSLGTNLHEEPADIFMRIALERKRLRECSMDEDIKRVKLLPCSEEAQPRKGKKRMRPTQLPAAYGRLPSWLISDPRVGGIPVHPTHKQHLGWHRGMLWCWACGRYATRTPLHLKDECEKPTEAGHNTLVRLRQGKHPYMTPWPLPEV